MLPSVVPVLMPVREVKETEMATESHGKVREIRLKPGENDKVIAYVNISSYFGSSVAKVVLHYS